MTMYAGSVTVTRVGNVVSRTGAGLSLDLFDVEVAIWNAQAAALVAAGAPNPDRDDAAAATVKKAVWDGFKARAEGYANAIIDHLSSNAEVNVEIAATSIDGTHPVTGVPAYGSMS